MITARQYSSGSEIIAGAAAVRQRLFSPQIAPRKSKEPSEPVITRVYTTEPVERVWARQQDSHMAAYYEWKGNEPLGFLKLRCREIDIDFDCVVGMTRKCAEVQARGKLIAEVKTRFPDMSLHMLGKLFGGRDHTTILHFLHKHGIRQARPRTDVGYIDTIRRMFFAGALYNDIAATINRSPSTISNIVKERGWTRERQSLAENAERIREMVEDGKSAREIAPVVGYCRAHVSAFIRAQGWTR